VQPYLIGILAGYCLGSIPSAYLIVRKRSGVDIRNAGSGNVGSFNTFVVTKSTGTAIVVGVLDALKGLAAVLGATLIWHEFWPVGATLAGAILGHIFPFWLRFRGGRGLATGCGGLFGLGLSYTIVWCVTWALVKATRRSILTSNIVALVVAPVVLWLVPDSWIASVSWSSGTAADFRIFGTVLSGVLMIGHRSVFLGTPEPAPPSQGVEQ